MIFYSEPFSPESVVKGFSAELVFKKVVAAVDAWINN